VDIEILSKWKSYAQIANFENELSIVIGS